MNRFRQFKRKKHLQDIRKKPRYMRTTHILITKIPENQPYCAEQIHCKILCTTLHRVNYRALCIRHTNM